MGQEARALAAKPDDLNLIPKIHVEEKNELPRAAPSLPHIFCVMTAPCTQLIIIILVVLFLICIPKVALLDHQPLQHWMASGFFHSLYTIL